MKRLDDASIDPEVAASLDAIDATLAGDPVDPKFAELAELALLLTVDRPECSDEFGREMDARVARKFQAPPAHASAEGGGDGGRRRSRRAWLWTPAWAGGAIAAAVAVVFVLSSLGNGASSESSSSTEQLLNGINAAPALTSSTPSASTTTASSASSASGGVASSRRQSAARSPVNGSGQTRYGRATSKSTGSSAASATPGAQAQFGPSLGAVQAAPAPAPSGRKLIQGAELYLTARPTRIDAVAQEVFDVVGAQNGFVNRSSVTASNGPGAYAQFQLSVPSQNLQTTMTDLSRLRYASVASRTDNTQDVNNQYNGDVRALNDAKALRTKLLKQLAAAVTTVQIDSLQAQIHDADAQISADEARLNSLNHAINYSQINVTINGYAGPGPVAHHNSSGFTLGKAAHDAGRVLTVAAGVALITLAALVPIGLVVALGWWITTAIQRRRREHALDMA